MGASVKIMLSYDYCHFEICLSTDQEISNAGVNEMRIDAQKLADEAVRQYKIAKNNSARRVDNEMKMRNFEDECKRIERKDEVDRTLKEIGMLKQYKDEKWQEQFDGDYDYEDDVPQEYRTCNN